MSRTKKSGHFFQLFLVQMRILSIYFLWFRLAGLLPTSYLFSWLFPLQCSNDINEWILLKVGFEPRIIGVGGKCSANGATATALHMFSFFQLSAKPDGAEPTQAPASLDKFASDDLDVKLKYLSTTDFWSTLKTETFFRSIFLERTTAAVSHSYHQPTTFESPHRARFL